LPEEFSILLVTKESLQDGSTSYAQGGIAFAIGQEDSIDLHVADTLEAGVDFCDKKVVEIMVREGRAGLELLQEFGMHFDHSGEHVSMHREGGHSIARVAHHGDSTGAEVSRALSARIRSASNITAMENVFLTGLQTDGQACTGAECWAEDHRLHITAQAVVLASGGAGQLYSVTTNPSVITGDGIAAAYEAGAQVADIEFIQFHPTALYEAQNPRFLISEAVRGEGAHILNLAGERIMLGKHPLKELAPRDVVVRTMALHMIESGDEHLWLDVRHLDQEHLTNSFPMITGELQSRGYNTASDLIPISFAAHYTIGGVVTDASGRSTMPNLFACGETACSGVHGANRLASNSLLEGIVFSRRIAADIAQRYSTVYPLPDVPAYRRNEHEADPAIVDLRNRFAQTAFRYGGVFRSGKRLDLLASHLAEFTKELAHLPDSIAAREVRNMMTICRLLIRAASTRCESRGTHQRQEFAYHDDFWHEHHIAFKSGSMTLVQNLNQKNDWN